MTQPKRRLPPLTPEQARQQRDLLQRLYGERALPKPPVPAPPIKDGQG